jgi:AbiTii
MVPMARREQSLVEQIERDALDEGVSVAATLRKCIALGGRSGSEQLRDWATRELQGYYGEDDELPDYRVINAPLMVDGVAGSHQVTHQQIPPSSLPDFAREHINERVELRQGVGDLAALAAQDQIRLQPRMASDLTRIMNSESGPHQHVISLYWSVAPAALQGVLDQIRTALTQLVAEMTAAMPAGESLPSAAAANQAVQVIQGGRRNRLTINTAQAGDEAVASAGVGAGEESGSWTTGRRIGAFLVGLATIAGAAAAIIGLH